jgi:cytidylate kinase
MIQGLIAKKAIDIILKKVMEKREVKKLRKYVEEDNELDIQVKQMQKTMAKQGKYIEELEKNVAILSKNSHPAIFTKSEYKKILKRLKDLENAK